MKSDIYLRNLAFWDRCQIITITLAQSTLFPIFMSHQPKNELSLGVIFITVYTSITFTADLMKSGMRTENLLVRSLIINNPLNIKKKHSL